MACLAPIRGGAIHCFPNKGRLVRSLGSLTFLDRDNRLSILPNESNQRIYSPVLEQRNDRSPFALAMEWTSRITTISLEMVVPALVGYWLDRRLGTHLLFLVLGVMLGFVTAMLSLLRLTRPPGPDHPPDFRAH